MSDEMYLLPQITHYPLLITRNPSLILDEVAKWAGAFKDVEKKE